MVDEYWKKVKAKFSHRASEQLKSERASNGSGSYAHLRQRSLSPYDPEGKNRAQHEEYSFKSSPRINPRHIISNLPEDINSMNQSRISGTPLSSHTGHVTNMDEVS